MYIIRIHDDDGDDEAEAEANDDEDFISRSDGIGQTLAHISMSQTSSLFTDTDRTSSSSNNSRIIMIVIAGQH